MRAFQYRGWSFREKMAIEIGQKVGEYEVISRLGAGGLGVVYQVRHAISQRAEALKVLHPEQTSTPEMVERFRREVQMLATLDHPNIAALHNAFYYEGQLVMVMELIAGETLRARSLRGSVTIGQALHYAAQMLSALAFAHRAGVVHRDIKPSNVMITRADAVKLLDFGIAITGTSSELTLPGFLVGSLQYMAPEQVEGGKATARSDIYAVGVTLYELVAGRPPIPAGAPHEIMHAQLHDVPPAPMAVNPVVPQSVSDAIMRALAKHPQDRFGSADEFAEALTAPVTGSDSWTRTAPAPAPSVAPISQAARPVTGSASVRGTGSSAFHGPHDPQVLEALTKQLAEHIGPVARLVVKKLAAECTDTTQLYTKAAAQIPSETGRQKFLRSRVR